MKGTLVFDHMNDLIYINSCPRFVEHVRKLAVNQGLTSGEFSKPSSKRKLNVDPNIVIQLFSPLVTSQRFMREQFGNPYTSMQCEDGTNIVFHNYSGFLFLRIGTAEVSELKRSIGIAITLVQYLCGYDVSLLKSSSTHSNLLTSLLDSWSYLRSSDESFMLEGITQLKVDKGLNSSLISALRSIVGKLQGQMGNHLHVLLFLETKLLSLYSAKNAMELGPEDLLFLMLLCHKTRYRKQMRDLVEEDEDEFISSSEGSNSEFQSSEAEGETQHENDQWEVVESDEFHLNPERDLVKYAILLRNNRDDKLVPHIVHLGIVQDGLYFVLLSQPPTASLISPASTTFQLLSDFHSRSRDISTDKAIFDLVEPTIKKLQDQLKKQKNLNLRNELGTRWDKFRSGFQQYLKTKEPISVQATPLVELSREIFRFYFNMGRFLELSPSGEEKSPNKKSPNKDKALDNVWSLIKTDTEDFWGFLRLKAMSTKGYGSNLLLESRENMSINKYLEEFPGLVHFIYVDRSRHSLIMPTVDFSKDETVRLTKAKIWGMIKFVMEHMQQGHFSIMWKDSVFNYAYFMWFEDSSGTPIRAKQPALAWEGYPPPGIMCGNFYRRVLSDCFPSTPSSKIRCVELFCIHLGLATSSCVLEHCKRLATNIFDEYCGGSVAADLA